MCGIISVLSTNNNICNRLLKSLERLEYRGYDSSGIAYLNYSSHKINRIRTVGNIAKLYEKIGKININSSVGIGHTRWATNGIVNEQNAHPHIYNGIAIVHNGIIENYQELKEELTNKGHVFETETDSEVIPHLISHYIDQKLSFKDGVLNTIRQLKGNFAFVAICEQFPNIVIGTRQGAPLVIGLTNENTSLYLASDAVALSSLASRIVYLEDSDIVILNKNNKLSYQIIDKNNNIINREVFVNDIIWDTIDKQKFETFMLKEIFEEPKVLKSTFDSFKLTCIDINKYSAVSIIGCGTSYHAGLLGKYWIENNVRIFTTVETASEFRYRNPVLSKNTLYILISQSGETSDTLCVLKMLKQKGMNTLAIVNVKNSSIAREADNCIYTESGPEIGVASTKSLISQMMVLLCLSKPNIDQADPINIQIAINSVLNQQFQIKSLAEKVLDSKSLFYMGRGTSFPVALEGALKVKELSYMNAEGLAGGELKHGPIAVIDKSVYTITLAPQDEYFPKTLSNIEQIRTRHGKILLITTENNKEYLSKIHSDDNIIDILYLPTVYKSVYNPFILMTSIHLLAYYVARIKGYDVDKPRNLAKSVTVE